MIACIHAPKLLTLSILQCMQDSTSTREHIQHTTAAGLCREMPTVGRENISVATVDRSRQKSPRTRDKHQRRPFSDVDTVLQESSSGCSTKRRRLDPPSLRSDFQPGFALPAALRSTESLSNPLDAALYQAAAITHRLLGDLEFSQLLDSSCGTVRNDLVDSAQKRLDESRIIAEKDRTSARLWLQCFRTSTGRATVI